MIDSVPNSVVPAPAGVARQRGPDDAAPIGRPRACGGCSWPTWIVGCCTRSSPRLRGLLGPAREYLGQQFVVPAPAGVAPELHNMTRRQCRRPRACGGCSITKNRQDGPVTSSPRLRGLLDEFVTLYTELDVVPAPAGVAPRRGVRPAPRSGRPRACGGCSTAAVVDHRPGESSPRLRGLLFDGGATPQTRIVVPAPAGVAPGGRSHGPSHGRRPRACGGCSSGRDQPRSVTGSSPRLRGLLPFPGGTLVPVIVVPAPAGVAPEGGADLGHHPCRPRACGGCSAPSCDVRMPSSSSPRLRGLLDLGGREHGLRPVVPAPAGVAPRIAGTAGTSTCRPRACGGCSQFAAAVQVHVGSSPRLRGLLLDVCHQVPFASVVPAPAEVAPWTLGSWTRSQGRPRACGGCSTSPAAPACGPRSSPRLRGLLEPPGEVPVIEEVVPAPAGVAPGSG